VYRLPTRTSAALNKFRFLHSSTKRAPSGRRLILVSKGMSHFDKQNVASSTEKLFVVKPRDAVQSHPCLYGPALVSSVPAGTTLGDGEIVSPGDDNGASFARLGRLRLEQTFGLLRRALAPRWDRCRAQSSKSVQRPHC
jgi:hypothetical protein